MVRAEALDPDNASILVAGGGGVALSVTRRLKDMGSWVWMLQRSDSRRSVSTWRHLCMVGVEHNQDFTVYMSYQVADLRLAFDQDWIAMQAGD